MVGRTKVRHRQSVRTPRHPLVLLRRLRSPSSLKLEPGARASRPGNWLGPGLIHLKGRVETEADGGRCQARGLGVGWNNGLEGEVGLSVLSA